MIALNVGDKIRGEASVAAVIDYTLHGIVGSTITQIADGQLAASETDIYTAASIVAVASIILVNTDATARTINLYLKPSSGTSRKLIPKNLSLGIGHSMHFDGAKITVMDPSGNILSISSAHKTSHQDGGADEISVTGLSGLLADDQHVLDDEVIAAVQVKARAYLSANQLNLVNATWTKILLNAENYDVGANFDPVTNYYFTVPKTGYYLIVASTAFINTVLDKRYGIRINKNNGTEISVTLIHASFAESLSVKLNDILFLSTNNTVQLDAYSGAGVDTVDIAGDPAHTFLAIHLLST